MDWRNLETFSFGDSPELADKLLALVLDGRKTATCWAASDGYAPEINRLWEPDPPPDQEPNAIGRARFGRITIANSDAGRAAYTDIVIDQAHRAVGELLAQPS